MNQGLPSDEKTERLLNLVLALLGSRKFLKKSEILNQIPGYEGSVDSKERMFERDKDELRRIGIPIETSQIDPLFDDEIGYRISKEKFHSNMPPLNSTEATVASVALKLISHLGLSEKVQRVMAKIEASSKEENSILKRIISIDSLINIPATSVMPALIDSVRKKETISFLYQRENDSTKSLRLANPLQLKFVDEDWYLSAWDLDRKAKRNFLVDQMSEIKIANSCPMPESSVLEMVDSKKPTEIKLKVPVHFIPLFELEKGRILDQDESFAIMIFYTFNVDRFLRIALSITSKFSVIEPESVARDLENLLVRLKNAI